MGVLVPHTTVSLTQLIRDSLEPHPLGKLEMNL